MRERVPTRHPTRLCGHRPSSGFASGSHPFLSPRDLPSPFEADPVRASQDPLRVPDWTFPFDWTDRSLSNRKKVGFERDVQRGRPMGGVHGRCGGPRRCAHDGTPLRRLPATPWRWRSCSNTPWKVEPKHMHVQEARRPTPTKRGAWRHRRNGPPHAKPTPEMACDVQRAEMACECGTRRRNGWN